MKKSSYRDKRLAKLIYNEISLIINYELDDEILEDVTITDVLMARDLGMAKIYFISSNKSIDVAKLKIHLDKAKSYIKALLSERLTMKKLPQLEFIIDETVIYSEKIEKIIDELNRSH
jgi:ribosome-binding factor A